MLSTFYISSWVYFKINRSIAINGCRFYDSSTTSTKYLLNLDAKDEYVTLNYGKPLSCTARYFWG